MSPPGDNPTLSQEDIEALISESFHEPEPLPGQAPAQVPQTPQASQPAPPRVRAEATTAGRPITGSDLTGLIERIDRLEKALSRIEGSEQAIRLLQAHVDIVSKESSALVAQLGDIPQHMRGTMGYRLREVFGCGSCGAKGTVASRIMCTSCHKESWWGWWPKKD